MCVYIFFCIEILFSSFKMLYVKINLDALSRLDARVPLCDLGRELSMLLMRFARIVHK